MATRTLRAGAGLLASEATAGQLVHRVKLIEQYTYAPAGGTGLVTVGASAPSISGTASNTSGDDAPMMTYTSAGSSGSANGVVGASFNSTRRAWQPDDSFIVKTPADLTNIRIWVGLASGALDASADPAVHIAALRYDTTVDGTAFFRSVTKDGTTANPTTTSLAVAANTVYRFRLVLGASAVTFLSSDADGVETEIAVHTANLPSASAALLWYVRGIPTSASARAIGFGRFERRRAA